MENNEKRWSQLPAIPLLLKRNLETNETDCWVISNISTWEIFKHLGWSPISPNTSSDSGWQNRKTSQDAQESKIFKIYSSPWTEPMIHQPVQSQFGKVPHFNFSWSFLRLLSFGQGDNVIFNPLWTTMECYSLFKKKTPKGNEPSESSTNHAQDTKILAHVTPSHRTQVMISFLSQPTQQKITNPIKLHGRHKTQRQKIPWNPNFLQFHCLHHYCMCKSKISAFHGLLASSRWKMPAASAASPPAARASSKCSGLPAPLEAMTGRVQADFTYEGSQWGVQWQRFREVSRLRLCEGYKN